MRGRRPPIPGYQSRFYFFEEDQGVVEMSGSKEEYLITPKMSRMGKRALKTYHNHPREPRYGPGRWGL